MKMMTPMSRQACPTPVGEDEFEMAALNIRVKTEHEGVEAVEAL